LFLIRQTPIKEKNPDLPKIVSIYETYNKTLQGIGALHRILSNTGLE